MLNVIYKTSIFANISPWNEARLVLCHENIKVDIKQLFYKDWAKRDVYMINDVLDETRKNNVISKVSGHL
jgi:hypothetical protein